MQLQPDTAAGGAVIYDVALQLGIAVCLWILIDLVGARGPRRARAPVALLAAGALLCAVEQPRWLSAEVMALPWNLL